MKRGIVILSLVLISILFISGCAQMASKDYGTYVPSPLESVDCVT